MTKIISILVFTIFSISLYSQSLAELNAQADTLLNQESWAEAALLYEKLLKNDEAEQVWNNYRLGQCYRHLDQNEKAMAAYRQSIAKGDLAYSKFQMGMLFAKLNQADSAFHHLNLAVSAGLTAQSYYEDNEHMAAHKKDPRYAKLIENIDRQNRPCQYEPKARQFDFWVGDWKVFNPAGVQVGTNKIERILDDCIIFENWTNSRGNQGKSFNSYDASAGIWRQTWVDQNGSWTEFKGGWDGTNMVVTTDDFDDPNSDQRIRRRMTFTPNEDGSVRQHGQRSSDSGKTWVTEYDLTYRKDVN